MEPVNPNPWVEWGGAGTGLLGSALLATNSSVAGYGFVAFLASNVLWTVFGIKTRTWSIVTMQVFFMMTSLAGIYRWLL